MMPHELEKDGSGVVKEQSQPVCSSDSDVYVAEHPYPFPPGLQGRFYSFLDVVRVHWHSARLDHGLVLILNKAQVVMCLQECGSCKFVVQAPYVVLLYAKNVVLNLPKVRVVGKCRGNNLIPHDFVLQNQNKVWVEASQLQNWLCYCMVY